MIACAVGTPKFEGLLLSRSVRVWNGRGGVAWFKKARYSGRVQHHTLTLKSVGQALEYLDNSRIG